MSRGIGGYAFMKCLEESIEKEEKTRISWYDRLRAGNLHQTPKSKQFEVFKRRIEMSGPTITADLLKSLPPPRSNSTHQENHKFQEKVANLSSKEQKELLDEMIPVDPCQRKLLYDGFTKEEKGRYQYLRCRHRVIPEKKFRFPLLTSNDYGWRLDDVIPPSELKKPEHGRRAIINDTFYSRNEVPDMSNVHLAKSYTVMF